MARTKSPRRLPWGREAGAISREHSDDKPRGEWIRRRRGRSASPDRISSCPSHASREDGGKDQKRGIRRSNFDNKGPESEERFVVRGGSDTTRRRARCTRTHCPELEGAR